MTTKQEKEIYSQYRDLNANGWKIPNSSPVLCRSNGGSETLEHAIAKTVAGKVCEKAGYRTQSEAPTLDGKEADIIAFGHLSRLPIVIELERDVDSDVVSNKLDHYNIGPVREVYVVDLDASPDNPDDLYDHIAHETGLTGELPD